MSSVTSSAVYPEVMSSADTSSWIRRLASAPALLVVRVISSWIGDLLVLDLLKSRRSLLLASSAYVWVELSADVDPDPQLLACHVLTTPVLAAQQPSDDPACSSVNSDRAQISISGQGVPDDGAATPQKPPNGKQPSATPRRPGRSERPDPELAQLRAVERHVRHSARPHAGARQACRGARTTRAAAPARRTAVDRSRLGNAAPACPRRFRRVGCCPRPARAPRAGGAQRRPQPGASRWRPTVGSVT